MIPTYNCAKYLKENLQSLLAQAPDPEVMQIEVIDDHSTQDDPATVVKTIGKGRVTFYQQPKNVGYIQNFETCLLRAKGKLVHLLHGDDGVRTGFYQKIQAAFEENPTLGAAFCRSLYIDEESHWQGLSPLERRQSGVLENWLEKIASGQRVTTPSVVVKRAVYENLGGFDRRFSCAGEDWEMWVRIATSFPVWFEVEPLALYRVKRAGSLTEKSAQTGRLVKDMRLATNIISTYLPEYIQAEKMQKVLREARCTYARWALESSQEMCMQGRYSEVLSHALEAIKCNPSIGTSYKIANLILWQGLVLRAGALLRSYRTYL
ncbi:MAG: glycosyltransferase [Phormidesmis sp.]